MAMSLSVQADCKLSWCSKAKTTAEKTVCKSDVLRASDTLMNLLYQRIFKHQNILMGTRGTVRDDQRAFISLRNEVSYSEQALQHLYIERITALQNTLKQAEPDL